MSGPNHVARGNQGLFDIAEQKRAVSTVSPAFAMRTGGSSRGSKRVTPTTCAWIRAATSIRDQRRTAQWTRTCGSEAGDRLAGARVRRSCRSRRRYTALVLLFSSNRVPTRDLSDDVLHVSASVQPRRPATTILCESDSARSIYPCELTDRHADNGVRSHPANRRRSMLHARTRPPSGQKRQNRPASQCVPLRMPTRGARCPASHWASTHRARLVRGVDQRGMRGKHDPLP
jgi:hypothetical protein